jgi:hypothetical protein
MGKGRNKKSRNTKPIQQQVNKTHPNVNKPSGKVENIVSKTAEEVSKVKALTKEEDIAVAKVKSSDVPPQVDNKVLNKIWINLESTKRTYNRLKEKYENLYLTIKIENDSLKDESKKLKELDITLKNREEELSKKDKNIIDRERKLTEKEVNAKTGFLKENIEALSALEDEKNLLEEKIKKLHKNYSTKIENQFDERIESFESYEEKIKKLNDKFEKKLSSKMNSLEKETEKLNTLKTELESERFKIKLESETINETKEHIGTIIEERSQDKSQELIDKIERLENRISEIKKERNKYEDKLLKTNEVLAKYEGVDIVSIENKNQRLLEENDELKDQVNSQISEQEIKRLNNLDSEKKRWKLDKDKLIHENSELKQRVRMQLIDVGEKETNRDIIEGLKVQRDMFRAAAEEAKNEMEDLLSRDTSETSFPELFEIDKDQEFQTHSISLSDITTLKEFCEDLRNRISVNPDNPDKILYYSDRDVRSFLGGIAMSRLHLLQGISGTGKTSLATAFARSVGAGIKIIKVQAGWRDHFDLLGHFNSFDKRYRETDFIKALYEAQTTKFENRLYIILLDEMNLSRVEQYFADMLSTLELDEHEQLIEIPSTPDRPTPKLFKSHDRLLIPNNVWFVGTANHDETTVEFADKTYDRSHVMELPTRPKPFNAKKTQERRPINVGSLKIMFKEAEEQYQNEAQNAFDYLNDELRGDLETYFGIGWGNRLEKQMKQYIPVVLASGGDVSEGLDHILHTKILRKIRNRHDTQVEHFEKLKSTITESWGVYFGEDTSPERSINLLEKELIRLGVDRG